MARQRKPHPARQRKIVSLRGMTTQDAIEIDNSEKDIQEHQNLLEAIQQVPGFSALPEANRDEVKEALDLSSFRKNLIVFVGESGCGKSTAINAVLGQDILPSDGSGSACTSVCIEIDSANGQTPYGIIKFITREHWREEIETLQHLLRDGCDSEDETAIFFDKIGPVYPRLKKRDFRDMDVDLILDSNDTCGMLGQERKLAGSNVKELAAAIYNYAVQGQENSRLLPLVDAIHIHINSPVLQNGLVVVDVPGIHDSNRARAARALSYLHKTAAVCIVQPIIRAGSNANTYNLFEKVIEELDCAGRLDRVVLINTQSDTLKSDQVLNRYGTPALQKIFDDEMKTKKQCESLVKESDNQMSILANQKDTLAMSKKDAQTYKAKLTMKRNNPDKAIYHIPRNSGTSRRAEKGPALTLSEIQAQIDELEIAKSNAHSSIRVTENKNKDLQIRLEESQKQLAHLRKEFARQCLETVRIVVEAQQRSELVKLVRRHDSTSAELLREIDASENCADDLNSRIAKEIPVFCISAAVYLHLQKIRTDEALNVKAIDNLGDTGIPSLREHLQRLAEKAKDDLLNKILNSLKAAVRSVHLHVMETSVQQRLNPKDADAAADRATKILQERYMILGRKACDKLTDNLRPRINVNFIDKHAIHIEKALQLMVRLLHPYGECYTLAKGTGLYPQEYKALVAGNGVLTGKRKRLNFNADLARCLKRVLRAVMKSLYIDKDSLTIQALQIFMQDYTAEFESTYKDLRELALAAGVSPHAFAVSKNQFLGRKAELIHIEEECRRVLKDIPSEAVEGLSDRLRSKMLNAYGRAKGVQKGAGTLARMSAEVIGGVEAQNGLIIDELLTEFEVKVQELTNDVVKTLAGRLKSFARNVLQNCQDTLKQRGGTALTNKNPAADQVLNLLLISGLAVRSDSIGDDNGNVKKEAVDKDAEMDDADADMFFRSDDEEMDYAEFKAKKENADVKMEDHVENLDPFAG